MWELMVFVVGYALGYLTVTLLLYPDYWRKLDEFLNIRDEAVIKRLKK